MGLRATLALVTRWDAMWGTYDGLEGEDVGLHDAGDADVALRVGVRDVQVRQRKEQDDKRVLQEAHIKDELVCQTEYVVG